MIKSPIFSLNYHDYLIIFLCNFHEISWFLYVRMSQIHMSHDILIWYSHEINISIYVRSHLISHDFFHDLSWDFSVRVLVYIIWIRDAIRKKGHVTFDSHVQKTNSDGLRRILAMWILNIQRPRQL